MNKGNCLYILDETILELKKRVHALEIVRDALKADIERDREDFIDNQKKD